MGQGFKCRLKAGKKDSAEILIYEDIGESWFGGVGAKQFSIDLKALGDVSSIDVRINSYGGDVFDGLAIYNQLVQHKATITTHVDGIAASIASIIAMAGSTINIAENAFIMVHDAWGVGMGNSRDMREMADRLETVTGALSDVYVSRTGQKLDDVRNWMIAETWFNSADAIKNKFATAVVENMKVAASYDPAKHRFRNAPQTLAVRPDVEAARQRVVDQRTRLAASSLKRFG